MRKPVMDKDGQPTQAVGWLAPDGTMPEGQSILQAQYEEVEQTIDELLNREEDEGDEDDEDETLDGSAQSDTIERDTLSDSDRVMSGPIVESQSMHSLASGPSELAS